MKPAIIVRLILIALGVASATLLAHSAFGIRFNEDFLLFLDVVRDTIGVVVLPFELLIVKPGVRWLHEQGWVFVLYPHWKSAFVLMWLFFAATSRSDMDQKEWGDFAFMWFWAGASALVAGVMSGTVSQDHPAVLWWPMAGVLVFLTGRLVWRRALYHEGRSFARSFAFGMALSFCVLIVFFALAAIGIIPIPLPLRGVPSPGLVVLATLVAIIAAVYLLLGALIRRSDLVRIGLDTLAVLGGAAIIVYLAHLMA